MRAWPIILLFLCSLFAAISCQQEESEKGPTKAEKKMRKQPVSVVSVGMGPISRYLYSTGTIESEEAVDIYPKISGYVAQVYKDQGSRVKEGDVLMRLADMEWALEVESAKLSAGGYVQKKRQAQLAIQSLEKQLQQAELNIQEFAQTLQQMALTAEQMKREFDRSSERYRKRLISEDQYQQAKYNYEKAVFDEKANRIKLNKAKVTRDDTGLALERSHLDLENIELEHKKAEVTLRQAQFRLSQATINAPFDGVITFRDVNRGQLVSSSHKVFSLVNLSRLIVRLKVSEKDLPLLREGQNVVLRNDNFPDFQEQGTIRTISPIIDSDSGTVQITVDIAKKENVLLRPGIFVRASVEVETRPQAVLVPRSAILHERNREVVYVVKRSKAHKRYIESGIRSADMVEVLSGIEAGESLVLKGQHLLRDKQPVAVVDNSSR